jgi:dephospho-CoA kinase
VLRVGLTGGIGSGKSTVAGLLAERGALVLDADAIAREVVEPDGPAFAPIVERFGEGVVGADGRLDRAALAAVVFADVAAREALNAITHPLIGEIIAARVATAAADGIVVFDVPLLVEHWVEKGEVNRPYDLVVVVEAPRELRLERLEGRGVARADAEARMAVQATDEQRRDFVAAHGGVVVGNGDGLAALEAEVDRLWPDLERRAVERAAEAEAAESDAEVDGPLQDPPRDAAPE